jgi:hypothetical protein
MYQPLISEQEYHTSDPSKKYGLKAVILLAGLGVLAYTSMNFSPSTINL